MIEFRDTIQAGMEQLVNQRIVSSGLHDCAFSVATISAPLDNNTYFYTNVFERYCEFVLGSAECNPYVHLMVKLIYCAQSSSAYDSGWFGLTLTSKLITVAVQSGAPPHNVVMGFKLANSIVLSYIRDLVQNVDGHNCLLVNYSDTDLMQRIFLSFFNTFNGGSVYASTSCRKEFCRTLLETFVASTSYDIGYDSFSSGLTGSNSSSSVKLNTSVIYHFAPGFQLSDSTCCRGVVCMDIPAVDLWAAWGGGRRSNRGVVVVLLVDDNMELPAFDLGHGSGAGCPSEYVAIGSSSGAHSSSITSKAEDAYLSKLASAIFASCVDVVLCQKRVHPLLIRRLAKRGVLCVPRLSIRYLSLIRKLSGAIVLGNISCIASVTASNAPAAAIGCVDRHCLGILKDVRHLDMFGSRYVAAVGVDLAEVNSVEQLNASMMGVGTRVWSQAEYSQLCGRMDRVSTLFVAAEVENDCVELKYSCETIFRTITRLYLEKHIIFPERWVPVAVRKIREHVCDAVGVPSFGAIGRGFRGSPLQVKLHRATSSHLKGMLHYADVLEECGCLPLAPDRPGVPTRPPGVCDIDRMQCAFSHIDMFNSVIDAVHTVLDVDGIINV